MHTQIYIAYIYIVFYIYDQAHNSCMHLIHTDQLGMLLRGRKDTVSKTGVKMLSSSFLYNPLYTFLRCLQKCIYDLNYMIRRSSFEKF